MHPLPSEIKPVKDGPILDRLIAERAACTIYLQNGVKLEGSIIGYEMHPAMNSLLLTRSGITQLVNVTNVSTIYPGIRSQGGA